MTNTAKQAERTSTSTGTSANTSAELVSLRELTDRRFARANGRERKNQPIKALWDKHHEIIRRIVLGQNNIEIASALRCTKENVSTIRNEPLVQEQIRTLTGAADKEVVNVSARIAEIAPKAVDAMEEMLDAETTSSAVRTTIARDLLDRAGHAAPKQVQIASVQLTGADISEIKARAKASGVMSRSESESEVIDI